MGLRRLYYCLFRKREWMQALGCSRGEQTLRFLFKLTERAVQEDYCEVVQCAGEIREGGNLSSKVSRLQDVDARIGRLTRLLPYANKRQKQRISDARRTADYIHELSHSMQKSGGETEILFYNVFIPAIHGCFFYLGTQVYREGDVVAIPFQDEKNIFGVIKEVCCRDYWSLPVPLWKMKYIISPAPPEVANAYSSSLQLLKGDSKDGANMI